MPNLKIIRPLLLSHFYKSHKGQLPALRVWFIIRNTIDASGSGSAWISTTARKCGLKKKHLKRLVRRSSLFSGLSGNKLFYHSMQKVMSRHHLAHIRYPARLERIGPTFYSQLLTNKKFKGYITKCFMENDLRPRRPRNYTIGRISQKRAANHFGVSEKTITTNLKCSRAKRLRNVEHLMNITFDSKNEYGPWLLNNIGAMVNGKRLDSPKNYFLEYRIGLRKYVLCRRSPDIYKFTGVRSLGLYKNGATESQPSRKSKV